LTGAPLNGPSSELGLLAEINQAMRLGSICGLGHTAGNAIQSAITLGLIGETS
jgi:NADH:ubiquinone oxidoreductase subunit F (NADH-binding)